MFLIPTLILALATSPPTSAPPPAAPGTSCSAIQLAMGSCCCTTHSGAQCCGAAINCGAGVVSGCPCR